MITASTHLNTEYGQFVVNFHKTAFGDCVSFVMGNINQGSIPLRIHSSCLFGEAFHSNDCDCRQQLCKSLQTIERFGKGALIYLYQEGRGIGLENKIKCLDYQYNNNVDTVEAFKHYHFPLDARDYGSAIVALEDINISKHIRLMCNNPRKSNQLLSEGYVIDEFINLEYAVTQEAYNYLKTKSQKLNHNIDFSKININSKI